MNALVQVSPERKSILGTMASRYNMEPEAFERTLRATVVPKDCTKEQFAACLVVAQEHRLNPLTKEIFFFPARGGGVVPIVGVDGWIRIINEHPAFDGMEFDTEFVENKPVAVTCRMYRKDRSRPVSVTEFMSECGRSTEPWKQSPARMLRHKAMIQGARYAFGFSGIYDPDEAERFATDPSRDITPSRPPQTQAHPPRPVELAPPRPTPPAPPAVSEPVREIDYSDLLTGLFNEMSACEDLASLDESDEAAGWLADAPDDVKAEGRKIYGAEKGRIERQGQPVQMPPRPVKAEA